MDYGQEVLFDPLHDRIARAYSTSTDAQNYKHTTGATGHKFDKLKHNRNELDGFAEKEEKVYYMRNTSKPTYKDIKNSDNPQYGITQLPHMNLSDINFYNNFVWNNSKKSKKERAQLSETKKIELENKLNRTTNTKRCMCSRVPNSIMQIVNFS